MNLNSEERIIKMVYQARDRDINGTPTLRANFAFDQLVKRFKEDLDKLVSRLFIEGGEREDLLQEARIGFLKSIFDFDPNKEASFKHFAINTCVRRHVFTHMQQASRKKHKIHLDAKWLSSPIVSSDGDTDQILEDFIVDKETKTPLQQLLVKEEIETITPQLLNQLTPLEKKVYQERIGEESYKGIAANLDLSVKTVDNALVRIKKKAKKVYGDYTGDLVVDDENN